MLHIAIVDDRKEQRKRIGTFLEDYLDQAQISHALGIFCSGMDLLEQRELLQAYEVFFVNQKMLDMDGVSLLKKVKEYVPDGVYIIVSESKVFLPNCSVDVIPCVIKSKADLVDCMHIVEKRLYPQINQHRLFFDEGACIWNNEKIIYIESQLHKVEFHIKDIKYQVYTTYRTLNDIEKELNLPDTFIRIHQSFLVNIHYIQDVKNYTVFLTNGEVLKASRARYKNLKERFEKYIR